ncbi:hypothetical protein [Candidatus Poriferisodalis sp.]|uniref:hypothetical protein n=1 Tax=Candidatus Poriferisodalis sp. TaxID=3101277 RepID=UPI003B018307
MAEGEEPVNGDIVPEAPAEQAAPSIAINQLIQQVQVVFPSMVDAITGLAKTSLDLAAAVVSDIIERGQRQDEMDMVLVRGADRRADRGQRWGQFVGLLVLVFGAVLILTDRPVGGWILLSVAAAPFLGLVIWRNPARIQEPPAIPDDGLGESA